MCNGELYINFNLTQNNAYYKKHVQSVPMFSFKDADNYSEFKSTYQVVQRVPALKNLYHILPHMLVTQKYFLHRLIYMLSTTQYIFASPCMCQCLLSTVLQKCLCIMPSRKVWQEQRILLQGKGFLQAQPMNAASYNLKIVFIILLQTQYQYHAANYAD